MNTAPKVKSQAITPNGSTPIDLVKSFDSRVLITFNGSQVGTITITGKVWNGLRYTAVANGTIDLATVDYAYLQDIPLESVNIAYSGSATALTAVVTQLDNRG